MDHAHSFSIFPLGDSALLIEFGTGLNEQVNKKVLQLFYLLRQSNLSFITNLVPAYNTLTVHYNLFAVYSFRAEESAFDFVSAVIKEIAVSKPVPAKEFVSRLIDIPVCYSREYGPDLEELAKTKNLQMEELVQLHTSRTYRVYMIGFLPGFAYMGEVDDRLAVGRKSQPRHSVAAGSVGIAGKQTGIYPLTSPGGWQIIGRTPFSLFSKNKKEPVLLQPGDEVQFYSITEDEFIDYQRRFS